MQTAAVRQASHPASSWEENSRSLQAALELSMMNLNNTAFCALAANGMLEEATTQYESEPALRKVTYKSNNVTECVPVPTSEHVAEIVGRQGCKIKALRAKTNTYIKTPIRGEEPVFVITGRPDDVAAAKREILSAADHFTQIRAARKNASVTANTTSFVPFSSSPPSGEEHVTIHVRVPYRVVGLVVGPKGATIKRIQQNTNTYIVTPSRDKEPCFEVTGSRENVEKAKEEIESYIAMRTGGSISDDDALVPTDGDSAFNLLSRSPLYGSKAFQLAGLASGPTSADPFSASSKSFHYPPPGAQAYFKSSSNGFSDVPVQSSWPTVAAGSPLTSAVFASCNSSMPVGTPAEGNSLPIPITRSMSMPSQSVMYRQQTVFDMASISSVLMDVNGHEPPNSPPSPVNSLSSTGSDGISSHSPQMLHKEIPIGCLGCQSGDVVAALVPCGHHLFCQSCAVDLVSRRGHCPVCHITAENMLRIYRAHD